MENEVLSLIASFIAMAMVAISYFVRKKELYLLFQSLCSTFLILSYFFAVNYFAMVGLMIALFRSLVFFAYEKRDKLAPIWLCFLISGLTLVSFFVINICILEEAKPVDILHLVALVLYAFIFRIRSLKVVRFTMLAPTALEMAYTIASSAAIGAVLTYVFELAVNVISIVRFHILPQKVKDEPVYYVKDKKPKAKKTQKEK